MRLRGYVFLEWLIIDIAYLTVAVVSLRLWKGNATHVLAKYAFTLAASLDFRSLYVFIIKFLYICKSILSVDMLVKSLAWVHSQWTFEPQFVNIVLTLLLLVNGLVHSYKIEFFLNVLPFLEVSIILFWCLTRLSFPLWLYYRIERVINLALTLGYLSVLYALIAHRVNVLVKAYLWDDKVLLAIVSRYLLIFIDIDTRLSSFVPFWTMRVSVLQGILQVIRANYLYITRNITVNLLLLVWLIIYLIYQNLNIVFVSLCNGF